MTPAQRQAIGSLYPLYGIMLPPAGNMHIDINPEFRRIAPAVLEIGFGNGAALIEMAKNLPTANFLGIEVYQSGIGRLLSRLKDEGIENVRVIRGDAVELMEQVFSDAVFDKICLFFPDPWTKKKHHKRRILQPGFISLITEKLKPGGLFHIATDWQDYAEQSLILLENSTGLINTAGSGKYAQNRGDRPETKFEKRGLRLGHGIWDIIMQKPL